MKEYLDPTDWSLKLVNVDNDAAQPDWIEVPEGANRYIKSDGVTGFVKHYAKLNPDIWDAERELWRSGYYEENDLILWLRQKPRVRVYATLSQSKFKPDLQTLRSAVDKAVAEAAADWSALGWREAARKQILQDWKPDWTQAPKGCDWFAVDSDGTGTFMNYEPEMLCGTWVAPSSTIHIATFKVRPGTNFRYQGDWRDSLRKRPFEWQPDWTQAPKEANYATINAYGNGEFWHMYADHKPIAGKSLWCDQYGGRLVGRFTPVGYLGDWRDSLRKRGE